MKTTWTSDTDAIALTTYRGPWESDNDFLDRHAVDLKDALTALVAPESIDALVDGHRDDIEADLGELGDALELAISIP